MLDNYEKYLNMITAKLGEFFEKQKPYIKCKRGCSLCCEKGEYPWSFIEYQYIMKGFETLPQSLQSEIKERINKIKANKEAFKGDGRFLYECPFLINKSCSLYNYRGIICRSFGLIANSTKEGKKPQIPFCCNLGLNYSNVYDPDRRSVSSELYAKTGLTIEPKIYNVSYNFLTEDAFADGYGFKFGDKKPLIDWF